MDEAGLLDGHGLPSGVRDSPPMQKRNGGGTLVMVLHHMQQFWA